MHSAAGRPRASHLTAGFLRSRTKTTLGSLIEADENSPQKSPLSDRNLNRAPSPASSSSSTSTVIKSKVHASPAKRGALTPKVVGANKSGRRRSNVGPLRVERPRRRSTMIPQLSPKLKNPETMAAPDTSILGKSSLGSARRIALDRSPSVNQTRASTLTTSSVSRPPSRLAPKPSESISADMSVRGSIKPSWR